MRLTSLILLLVFYNTSVGQEKMTNITIEIQNGSIKELLHTLEKESKFKFYYAEEWLDSEPISKSYQNISIEEILNDIFEDTEINYFIDFDNRIILTQNNIIYGDLPEDYFGRSVDSTFISEAQDLNSVSPILMNKQKSESNNNIGTIRIGKESKNIDKKKFKLSGYVRDSISGNPISNLSLVVKALNIGTVTNNKGYYEIQLPAGVNLIETSALGIKITKLNVIIYNDGILDFNLNENYEQLSEVLIQVEATKNIESTKTGNARIGSEDSKSIPLVLGERDVLKVALTLPGVTTAGEGSSGFNVRGGKTDQNLIILDDAVVYNPSHFFGIFPALNPFAIKDINIYKGSIPVEYGGRLSSVFDINTKEASNNGFKGEVSIGPVTANAVLETPIVKDKSGFLIGARAAYSDWVLKSLKDSELKNSQASFYDLILKYNHKLNNNNTINGTAYYSDDKFSITSDSLFSYNNRMISVNWNHTFNENSFGSIILNNSQYKFNIEFDGSINTNFTQWFQIDETELKLRLNYLLNEAHKFNYGVSGKLYSILPGEIEPSSVTDIILPLSIPKEKGLESAIFISDNIKVNEKLQVDLGLRYSFYAALGPSMQRVYEEGIPRSDNTVIGTETFNSNEIINTYGGPEARVSARYLLNDNLSVKAGFNNTYQFIHSLSNNTTVSPIDTWKLSDKNIKPQQAKQITLGIYKNININDYEFSLEGFYKKQKNILDFKTGAQLLLNENVETEVLQGEGKAYGLEFLVRKNNGNLNGWFGYTYSRSFIKFESDFNQERVNDGEFFPSNYDKPHDFSFVVNYKFSRRISLSSNFVYQTGRPITFPIGIYTFNDSNFVLYSDRNQFRIPDYYRLDLGINFEGNHKKKKFIHSFWSISIYNLLGRNNPYSVFFVTQEGEVKALQSSIFSIPVPSITYNFRF